MKRLLAWLLLCCLTAACAGMAGAEGELRGYSKGEGYVYLSFGEYPQTAEGEVLPILWRVLETDEEKAYVLSEYILFARSMHTSLREYRDELKGDFAQTELCHYLNTEFAEQAFPGGELEMLLPCEDFGKVFLISRDDMKNKNYGLGSTNPGTTSQKKIEANPGVRAWGTEWAIRNNGFPEDEYPDPKARVIGRAGAHISQEEMRLYVFAARFGSCSPWWARTQSTTDERQAVCTKDGGQIGRIEVGRDNEGVRPAVYLALDAFEIAGGAGTKEDPYVIRPKGKDAE